MKLTKWLIWLLLVSSFLGYINVDPLAAETPLPAWETIPVGSKVYAEVIEAPEAIYRQLTPDAPPEAWVKEPNSLLFGQAINVSAKHRFLDVEHVVRVTVVAGGWGMIEPDGDHSPYIPDPLNYHPAYVELKYLHPLLDDAFAPFNVYADTRPMDKVVVVIRAAHPSMVLFEGSRPVMHVPVVLGPTNPGDYRVYRTRATDDMPGIPGVPFSNYFSGGFTIHGSPWWNWRETVRGHYGSHGCVNLPDREWYQPVLNGVEIPVAQWVYQWLSTNIDYDETDPAAQQAEIRSSSPEWYQAIGSVRVIIIESIDQIWDHPIPPRLGNLATDSQITTWQPLVDAYNALDGEWLLLDKRTPDSPFIERTMPSNQSIAQIEGTADDAWILLDCPDRETHDQLAYEGASRTVGEVCFHLIVERQNSICTPERVDIHFFGRRVLCNAARFNLLHIEDRGALIEHERVHLAQFGGYYKELFLQGVAIDDPTPHSVNYDQLTTIGVTELMAQWAKPNNKYSDDYAFVLVRPNGSGGVTPFHRTATAQEAWDHLRRECGDPDLNNPTVQDWLERGLMGDAEAYQRLERVCSMPPHRLVPDRWRVPPSASDEDAGGGDGGDGASAPSE